MADDFKGRMNIQPPQQYLRRELEALKQMPQLPSMPLGSVVLGRWRLAGIRKVVEEYRRLIDEEAHTHKSLGDLADAKLYRQRMEQTLENAHEVHQRDAYVRRGELNQARDAYEETEHQIKLRRMARERELAEEEARHQASLRNRGQGSIPEPQPQRPKSQAEEEQKVDLLYELQKEIDKIKNGRNENELAHEEKELLIYLRNLQKTYC